MVSPVVSRFETGVDSNSPTAEVHSPTAASSYIVRRPGGRWQVRYRLGGRESRIRDGRHRAATEAWRSSRLDVSAGTDATYAVSIGRIRPALGSLELGRLDTRRVARFGRRAERGRSHA